MRISAYASCIFHRGRARRTYFGMRIYKCYKLPCTLSCRSPYLLCGLCTNHNTQSYIYTGLGQLQLSPTYAIGQSQLKVGDPTCSRSRLASTQPRRIFLNDCFKQCHRIRNRDPAAGTSDEPRVSPSPPSCSNPATGCHPHILPSSPSLHGY